MAVGREGRLGDRRWITRLLKNRVLRTDLSDNFHRAVSVFLNRLFQARRFARCIPPQSTFKIGALDVSSNGENHQ